MVRCSYNQGAHCAICSFPLVVIIAAPLPNFIQESLNTGSVEVQILLAVCQICDGENL